MSSLDLFWLLGRRLNRSKCRCEVRQAAHLANRRPLPSPEVCCRRRSAFRHGASANIMPSRTVKAVVSAMMASAKKLGWHVCRLSGPISRDTAILSLRYHISRDTFSGRLALPQNGAIPPSWHLVSHRHIRAIPHFATYRAIIVRYPIKTSTKDFRDTIATSIARYEKYRCWAS